MQPQSVKPATIKAKGLPLLKKLSDSDKNAWIFQTAVDPVALNLPDYFAIVPRLDHAPTNLFSGSRDEQNVVWFDILPPLLMRSCSSRRSFRPMDLGTVGRKLTAQSYREMAEFVEDVKLVFENAISYNGASSESIDRRMRIDSRCPLMQSYSILFRPTHLLVTAIAKSMRKTFDKLFGDVKRELDKEEDVRKVHHFTTCFLFEHYSTVCLSRLEIRALCAAMESCTLSRHLIIAMGQTATAREYAETRKQR